MIDNNNPQPEMTPAPPVIECCKCEAYREILAQQSVSMAAMKKDLQQALTFFEAAHSCIARAEKIKP